MKLKQAVEVFTALTALAATKLPAKTGYRVAKTLNAFRADVALYEEERNKLVSALGIPMDDNSGNFKLVGESFMKFNEQHEAMLDEEVTPSFFPITPEDLGNVEIEPQHLAVLDGIFIKETQNETV